jgi:hypothetical protein
MISQALFLQATALGGAIRYARGDRPALWPKAERTGASREIFESPPAGDDPAPGERPNAPHA